MEEEIIREIEALKDTDESLYTIFALGERAITRENIYSNFNYLETKPERFTNFIRGLDFGFIHPTALVKIWYYENELFLELDLYKEGLTADDLVLEFDSLKIEKNIDIMADHARPEIIQQLRKAGYRLNKADKAVKEGIMDVKTFKVYTNSKEIIKEYENYRWRKSGDKLFEEPIKLLDDAMDAIRYGVRIY